MINKGPEYKLDIASD